jgi:putative membrane protein
MTGVMVTGWQFLPATEKYPLPPLQITGQIAGRVGVEDQLSEGQLVTATLLSHFGYGALFGSVYAALEQKIPLLPSVKGILTGLAVWVGSYLGWLPAAGILPPATRHPWRRNLLMIAAHFVWGLTMGALFKKLNSG